MAAIYRAGIVGAGQIGRAHAVGYQGVDSVEVVAVTEPNERVRKEFQEKYSIPNGYSDMKAMLDAENLDFVSVCTWHLLHEAHTTLASEYLPKAIICEKPMTVGMASVKRMMAVCEARHVKLVIGHQRRYYHSWTKARELVAAGAIGTPLMITGRNGEGLLNCGTHMIDAFRYILGDPETEWVMGSVDRKTDRYERNVRIEDACLGLIQFKGGAQGLLLSDLTPDTWSVEAYQIRGTDGLLETDSLNLRYINGSTSEWVTFDWAYDDPWVLQAKDMVRWVEGGDGHRGDARQASHAVEIMMAMYQSAREHGVVQMPLQEQGYPLDLMVEEGKIPPAEEGAYDIRELLAMEPDDRKRYGELRAQGMGHRDIATLMKTLR